MVRRPCKVVLAVSTVAAAALLGCGSPDSTTVRSEWWLTRAPDSSAELVFEVYENGSSCTSFDRVELRETADRVEILAYVVRLDVETCTGDYSVHSTAVELGGPLGDRALTGCSPDSPPGLLSGDQDPSRDCTDVGLSP